MKKLLLLLLLFTGIANAQIVNIPDANFKARLIALGIDITGDGQIQEFEASIVNHLELQNSNISNLVGIEYFTSLQTLYCDNNSISFLILNNPSLEFLYCSNNQIPYLNLTNCPNLKTVLCNNNQLNGINVSTNNNLEILWIYNNLLTSLDVTSCSSLQTLICNNNLLTSLSVNGLPNLTKINCEINSLTSLNLNSLPNLTSLECGGNTLSMIDVTNITSLVKLRCQANPLLTFLNVTTLINLEELEFTNCNITSIDVSPLVNLKKLSCGSNGISSLNISVLTNLEFLNVYNNLLTTLDLTNQLNLQELYCSYNNFSNLDINFLTNLSILQYGNLNLSDVNISNLTNLIELGYYQGNQLPLGIENFNNLQRMAIGGTFFTDLDISYLSHLNLFTANGNTQLTHLNLKNGNSEGITTISLVNNPNLSFICTNENDIQTAINGNGTGNGLYQVNSYCSFTPGGNYNTISGTANFDADINGCDASDALIPNIKFNLTDGINQGSTFTNDSGNYKFYTETGNFTLTPNVENPTFFNFSPASATINFSDSNNNITTQNFCISPVGIHPDLEVILAPITPARPGFDATYKLVYRNKGNQTLSQSYGVNFFFNQNLMEFVSASTIPTSAGPGGLSWSYTNLLPFESRSIEITLNINAPTETNPVNIDDILQFTTSILPMAGDETTSDNTFLYNQTVVGSFDPNDITCIEGETVAPSEIGKYLHYSVNFENTGTYVAENVVVKDVIDTTKYDINSLQLLSTSHDAYTRITGNVVEFIFENINLEAKTGNPPVGGHGNVLFKIKSKNDLVSGDSVSKSASIFFDYNAPISTNIEQTTFTSLSNSIFEFDNSVSIYPNPTSSKININSNSNIKSIELYDVQGRVLVTQIGNSKSLDISDKTNGIYFVKITTEKGSKVEKIVKK